MRLSLGNRMQKKSVSSAPIEGYLLVSVDSVCSKFFLPFVPTAFPDMLIRSFISAELFMILMTLGLNIELTTPIDIN